LEEKGFSMITPVELTPKAVAKLQEAIKEEKDPESIKGIRVGVRGGGCSGYNYHMDFQKEEPTEEDMKYDQWGMKVFVDPYSAALLEGTVIDYEDKLMGGGFRFDNPNANRTCGCGSSFSA
jgi:iron-sulfur cluster assembly protein